MPFRLDEAVNMLARTPAVLQALLHQHPLPRVSESADSWNPAQVVAHLIHGEETDWIPRTSIILEHGDARTFDPFVRDGFREYENDPLDALLNRFAKLREANLDTLRSFQLSPADLERTGSHPGLGTITLGQMLATWVAHDFSHISQIVRSLARHYRGDVGPWTAYLSILQ